MELPSKYLVLLLICALIWSIAVDILIGFEKSINNIKASMVILPQLKQTFSMFDSTCELFGNYTYTGASLFGTSSSVLLNYLPVSKKPYCKKNINIIIRILQKY
jgi:hypothetical protein